MFVIISMVVVGPGRIVVVSMAGVVGSFNGPEHVDFFGHGRGHVQ